MFSSVNFKENLYFVPLALASKRKKTHIRNQVKKAASSHKNFHPTYSVEEQH